MIIVIVIVLLSAHELKKRLYRQCGLNTPFISSSQVLLFMVYDTPTHIGWDFTRAVDLLWPDALHSDS